MSTINLETYENLFAGRETTFARDLKLNLRRLLTEGALSQEEALLATLATARSTGAKAIEVYAQGELVTLGTSADRVQEAQESAAIMGMLNTYYRFKHMVHNENDYKAAGLRMTGLAKPLLGKEHFEMLAFAVSIVNGCETCIRAHEKTLKDVGVPAEKLHDLARIAAVVKGLSGLLAE